MRPFLEMKGLEERRRGGREGKKRERKVERGEVR
jgi:hypothetical protein